LGNQLNRAVRGGGDAKRAVDGNTDGDFSHGSVSHSGKKETASLKVNEFSSNNANYLHLDFDASLPVTLQYLFFDNPRLSYYLNGERISLTDKNGVQGINTPAGHNTFEIIYRHWALNVFWLFYSLYALLFLWVLLPVGLINFVKVRF